MSAATAAATISGRRRKKQGKCFVDKEEGKGSFAKKEFVMYSCSGGVCCQLKKGFIVFL